jgi:hypothetical protein
LQEAVKPDLAQKEQDQLYHAAKLWKDGGHGSLPRDIVESWVDANNALLSEAASALLALEGERAALRETVREMSLFARDKDVDEALRAFAVKFGVAVHMNHTDNIDHLIAAIQRDALDTYCLLARPYLNRAIAAEAEVARLRAGLIEAEAAMSIVEPRNTKTKYLAALDAVRAALSSSVRPDGIPEEVWDWLTRPSSEQVAIAKAVKAERDRCFKAILRTPAQGRNIIFRSDALDAIRKGSQ